MGFSSLRWWAVLLPTIVIILVDYGRHELVTGFIHPWRDEAVLLVGVLIVTFATARLLFDRIDQSQRRERQAEALRRLGIEVTSSLELDAIMASVLTRGRELLGVDCLGVALSESPVRELIMQARGSERPRKLQAPDAASFLWEAMHSGELREFQWGTTSRTEVTCGSCRRCLAIPLRMGSHVLGALCAGSTGWGPGAVADKDLADQVASLASVAIANALLHRQAQQFAVLEERDRIAREMHDSLAQVLGYLSMKATAARELLARQELARLEAELEEIRQVADDAYLDVRESILGLRVSPRAPGGLVGVLEEYLAKFSRQSGLVVRLAVLPAGEPLDLPPLLEVQMVRVIQEALTNVRKHAHASAAMVRLERHDGQLSISIEDDGQGFDPTGAQGRPDPGFGLATMRERLAGVGGRLDVRSTPGKGSVVVATVPIAATQEVRIGEG